MIWLGPMLVALGLVTLQALLIRTGSLRGAAVLGLAAWLAYTVGLAALVATSDRWRTDAGDAALMLAIAGAFWLWWLRQVVLSIKSCSAPGTELEFGEGPVDE